MWRPEWWETKFILLKELPVEGGSSARFSQNFETTTSELINEATELLGKRVCKNIPISFYEPSETPHQYSLFYENREEENQSLMTEIADVVHLNPNSQKK